jgi:hypothetical protein
VQGAPKTRLNKTEGTPQFDVCLFVKGFRHGLLVKSYWVFFKTPALAEKHLKTQ